MTVADPSAIRARRVSALFVCGLQEMSFGRPPARRKESGIGTPATRTAVIRGG